MSGEGAEVARRKALTQGWLEGEYRSLNRRWFGGELPADTQLRWVREFPAPYRDAYGRTGVYRATGTKKGSRIVGFNITLSRRSHGLGVSTIRATLLHEMAHVATWRSGGRAAHGRAWVMEMRRLAALGAFDRIW